MTYFSPNKPERNGEPCPSAGRCLRLAGCTACSTLGPAGELGMAGNAICIDVSKAATGRKRHGNTPRWRRFARYTGEGARCYGGRTRAQCGECRMSSARWRLRVKARDARRVCRTRWSFEDIGPGRQWTRLPPLLPFRHSLPMTHRLTVSEAYATLGVEVVRDTPLLSL